MSNYTHNETILDADTIIYKIVPRLINHAIFLHNLSHPGWQAGTSEEKKKKLKEDFIKFSEQAVSYLDNLHSPG